MDKDIGRIAEATGLAGAEAPEPPSRLGPSGGIPCAVRFAIVRSRDGYLTVCGPNDFRPQDYPSMMDAALSFSLEAGHIPVAAYWANIELPPLPDVPELVAAARRSRANPFSQQWVSGFREERFSRRRANR